MARKKEFLLVLDTETCNSVNEPLPYDIGWAVCDRQGNIYVRRSYVVEEIFCDMKDVMASAYYAKKIPMYWEDIKSGKRYLRGFWHIRKQLIADMKLFGIKKVGAYNMAFDKKALNNLIRYVSKSWKRWFFPFGTEYFCIWNMACNMLLNTKTYINFALKNGFVSEKDNILTSAENCHRFLTNNIDFIESHTGLEDVEIEIAIMARCYRTHKKLVNCVSPSCWQKVQKKRKELGL